MAVQLELWRVFAGANLHHRVCLWLGRLGVGRTFTAHQIGGRSVLVDEVGHMSFPGTKPGGFWAVWRGCCGRLKFEHLDAFVDDYVNVLAGRLLHRGRMLGSWGQVVGVDELAELLGLVDLASKISFALAQHLNALVCRDWAYATRTCDGSFSANN